MMTIHLSWQIQLRNTIEKYSSEIHLRNTVQKYIRAIWMMTIYLGWKMHLKIRYIWEIQLRNTFEKYRWWRSTSSVLKAKNWGMLSPSPMAKLRRMCSKKFLLLCDRGRETIMNILELQKICLSLLQTQNCCKNNNPCFLTCQRSWKVQCSPRAPQKTGTCSPLPGGGFFMCFLLLPASCLYLCLQTP